MRQSVGDNDDPGYFSHEGGGGGGSSNRWMDDLLWAVGGKREVTMMIDVVHCRFSSGEGRIAPRRKLL